MRAAILTREYPPEVYGGAGVHVAELTRRLRDLIDVEVHCWGAPRDEAGVRAHTAWAALDGGAPHLAALRAVSIDLAMTAGVCAADLVHSHTWYANLAGHLAKLCYGVPHVATTHSLEPLRPWKAEQLGGGYALSSWCERVALESADAIVAVSEGMRRDMLDCYPQVDPARVRVIGNGIDTAAYRPVRDTEVLRRHGVDPDRPIVLFVGRITRQKGLVHLLDAAPAIAPRAQLVLCAGAPDTPELGAQVAARVADLQAEGVAVVWIAGMLPRSDLLPLLTAAAVFVCPSVYEPLGIVNLEAMACETAVVATDTGGIPEVVVDGVTGLLVPFTPLPDASRAPAEPRGFAAGIADRVNALLADPDRAAAMGTAGRARAVEHFAWESIAARVADLYRSVLMSRA
jgi:starch synthase